MTEEDTRQAAPADPEHDALMAAPTDDEEFAAPPPEDDPDPECRVTPDEPS